jgi:hypothetical protein
VKIGPDGHPRPDISTLSFDQGAALQALTIEEARAGRRGGRDVRKVKFKLGDKRLALVALGNHLGLFREPGVEAPPQNVARPRPPSMEEWEAELNARISCGR